MNKYKHEFTVAPASESQETLDYVNRILNDERCLDVSAKPLQTSRLQVGNIDWANAHKGPSESPDGFLSVNKSDFLI
jgi:hypothetical protein